MHLTFARNNLPSTNASSSFFLVVFSSAGISPTMQPSNSPTTGPYTVWPGINRPGQPTRAPVEGATIRPTHPTRIPTPKPSRTFISPTLLVSLLKNLQEHSFLPTLLVSLHRHLQMFLSDLEEASEVSPPSQSGLEEASELSPQYHHLSQSGLEEASEVTVQFQLFILESPFLTCLLKRFIQRYPSFTRKALTSRSLPVRLGRLSKSIKL